jgi:hypothetical protein
LNLKTPLLTMNARRTHDTINAVLAMILVVMLVLFFRMVREEAKASVNYNNHCPTCHYNEGIRN